MTSVWKCVPLVDLLNALLWEGRNGLPPTADTLHLGCSYNLHFSHRFLSTWGAVMLDKKKRPSRLRICVSVIEGYFAGLINIFPFPLSSSLTFFPFLFLL